ncbi:MAG: lipopolysaccharide biosynthesis protein [Acidobacteriota bacterium]|nr:lipopolysaccharide biosynthesis protein [Acidobacteriota bacterium]
MNQIIFIARRRIWWIVVPLLVGPLLGLLATQVVRPVFTSKAFVIIEQPKVPDKLVLQLNNDEVDSRLMTLKEQILSRSRLEPIIVRWGLFHDLSAKVTMDEKVEKLRKAIDIKTLTPEGTARVPSGFYITASADAAPKAQAVCKDILQMFMAENLRVRQQRAAGTSEFLSEQLNEAKHKLDEHDAALAQFKQQYIGQLPSDEQRNLEMLNSTRTRLEAVTQEVSQAQQQKIVQESAISQLNARKPAANVTEMTAAERDLATAKAQLATLQSRYTKDHPEIIELKAQIARLEAQVKANPSASTAAAGEATPDTPELRQLKVALRLTEETIRSKNAERASLAAQIGSVQSRLQLSPVVEERYKALTRDYETALQFYNDLLSKSKQSEMSTDLERRQEGEQFSVMDAPDYPVRPSFPDKMKFSLAGFGVGAVVGLLLAFLKERREQYLRNEVDVLRVLQLPLLVGIPELPSGDDAARKTGVLRAWRSLLGGARV